MCVDPEAARLGVRTGLQGNSVNKASVQNNSDMSGNDSMLYVGRASTIGRSGKFSNYGNPFKAIQLKTTIRFAITFLASWRFSSSLFSRIKININLVNGYRHVC